MREQYKEFGLLEIHRRDRRAKTIRNHDLYIDYSKTPTVFEKTWYTPDQKYTITPKGKKSVHIQSSLGTASCHSWDGKFEDSFVELKRLGYGKAL